MWVEEALTSLHVHLLGEALVVQVRVKRRWRQLGHDHLRGQDQRRLVLLLLLWVLVRQRAVGFLSHGGEAHLIGDSATVKLLLMMVGRHFHIKRLLMVLV